MLAQAAEVQTEPSRCASPGSSAMVRLLAAVMICFGRQLVSGVWTDSSDDEYYDDEPTDSTSFTCDFRVAVLLVLVGIVIGWKLHACTGGMTKELRSVMTQSQTTYKRDLTTPRFAVLGAGADGAW